MYNLSISSNLRRGRFVVCPACGTKLYVLPEPVEDLLRVEFAVTGPTAESRQRIGESGEVSSRVRRIEDGSSGIECARRRAERTGCDELRRTDRDSRSCRGRRCVKEGRRTARTASVGARERGTRVERISCGSGSILRRGNTMRVVTVLKICPVMERVVDCRGLLRSVKCRGRGRVAGRVVKVART